jgi:D-alanyl-D-alanine carboxypeptidase (penicillin-binding protein 5/6)
VRRIGTSVVAAALLLGFATPVQAARAPACPSSVGARSAIVVEVETGVVACARGADKRLSVGSTTKLMTALLTLENAELSDTFTAASYNALPVESKIGLQPGERMKVRDLMRGLLLESGNDAAVTLAEGVSGSRKAFVRQMNRRARRLDLDNTHFANPIGLDQEGNYSSARDLVTLATLLLENTFFSKVVDSPSATLKTGVRPRTFRNRNRLVGRYEYVNGVKTGHTRGAGYVLVGSARRNGIQLVSAVLGTPSESARDSDTMNLFTWAFPRFQRIRAVIKDRPVAKAQIRYRAGAELELVPSRTVRRIVQRGHRESVSTTVHAPEIVEGPIHRGQQLGRIEISQGGEVVATVPLIAKGSVPAADITQKTKAAAGRPWVLLLVAGAALGATVLFARRRSSSTRRGGRAGDPRVA